MTKDRCKCKCVQQSHGNYCVSNPSVQYQGMFRASGNVGVYDVVTFNISADVEKCWEGTGNQATLDAGGYNGVFVNLSGSNLGPNSEPKSTTPILPLTGIALSDELASNDSSQDQTRYSRQISYIFTGIEVDAATPHDQAYAIDWQLNAGSGSHETPSWWNPEDGKQVGVPPCSHYGRVVSIYEVPEGSSSGVKDTVIPLKTAGATDTNSVVLYERAVLNQSSYPDQPGKLTAYDMQDGFLFGDVSLVFLDDTSDTETQLIQLNGPVSGSVVSTGVIGIKVLDENGDPYANAPTYVRTISGEVFSGTPNSFSRALFYVGISDLWSFQNDFDIASTGYFEYEFLEDPLDLTIGSPAALDTLRLNSINGGGVTNTNINIVLEDGLGNKAQINDFDTDYYGNPNTAVNNPPNIKVVDFRLNTFSNYTGIDLSNITKVTLNPYSKKENADFVIDSGIQFVPKGTPVPVLLDPQPTGYQSTSLTGVPRLGGFPNKIEVVLGGYFDNPNIGGLNEDDVIQLQFNQVDSDNLVSNAYENYWCENVAEGDTVSPTNRLVIGWGTRQEYPGTPSPGNDAVYARARIKAYDTLGANQDIRFGNRYYSQVSQFPPQIQDGIYNFRELFSVDVPTSNASGLVAKQGANAWGFTSSPSYAIRWQKEKVGDNDGFFKSMTPIDE